MTKPNFAAMSIGEIREYMRKNRKPLQEMSDRELKEYVITVPDDREAEKEYVDRSTAQVLAKRNL
ncbi:MAG: hypothetical protein KME17_21815 [Cyanosarcina radialis HA8281-LM2]|jgi:uncharacterized protein YjiS (DUF1127 family)|nr:hypothetical protein [Cyanosarcina radialis HA8281-LM2]